MTKTLVTLVVVFYSVARLLAIIYYFYYDLVTLSMKIYTISGGCAGVCLVAAIIFWFYRISEKRLRGLLLFNTLCTCINIGILLLNPAYDLTKWDLLITGTVFDIIFFIGCCSIPLRDTIYQTGQTPYSRLGAKNNHKRLGIRDIKRVGF